MSVTIDLSSDESQTPPFEEVYYSKIIKKPKINNNKYILTTDSDSDLPELGFFDTNKQQQQQEPCSSLPASDLYIRSLVQSDHVAMVTEDFLVTGDVNLSINRYFDGAILCNIPEPVARQSSNQSDSDSLTPPAFIANHHDNLKLFRNAPLESDVSNFGTKTKLGVSKALFLDLKSDEQIEESICDFNLEFSPLSSISSTPVGKDRFGFDETIGTTPTDAPTHTQQQQQQQQQHQQQTPTPTPTDRKGKLDAIQLKRKQIDRMNRNSHQQLNYTITTTKCFDKHLLAHLKSGIKISNNNNVTFEQCTSEPGIQSVFWECQHTVYTLSELNLIQELQKRVNCDYSCIVLSMIEFSDKYQMDNEFLEKIIGEFANTRKLILIYGVGEYFSHLEAGDLPRATFNTLQTFYQIKLHLTLHISNTILEASDILVRIMRGVKGLANIRERKFAFSTHSPKKGRGVKNIEDQSRVWKHQLLRFSRVSEQIATAIVDRYPTPANIINAYKECHSEENKRNLLKLIVVNNRKIGTRISERIYLLFHCNDTEVTI